MGMPKEGRGDWYPCDLPKPLTARHLRQVVAMGQRHPEEPPLVETVCHVLAKAASSSAYSLDAGGDRDLVSTLANGGAYFAVKALVEHPQNARLQWKACQALWHITDLAVAAREVEAKGAVEALVASMLRFPIEKALQLAACAALANIIKHREKAPAGGFLREAMHSVAAAMQNFSKEVALQRHACYFLWQFAIEDPDLLSTKPGLKHVVEHAASLGIRDARNLVECVKWRTPAEVAVSAGGGRKRWGQWATGRHVAW